MKIALWMFVGIGMIWQLTADASSGIRVFKDWAVACNNVRECEAASFLEPDHRFAAGVDAYTASILLSRGGASDAPLKIRLSFSAADEVRGQPLVLKAGKQQLDLGIPSQKQVREQMLTMPQHLTGQFVDMIRQPSQLQVRIGREHRLVASLRGVTAAMLYMDEQQQRLDSSTALVRVGGRQIRQAAPSLPVIHAVRASKQTVVPKGLIQKIMPLADAFCEEEPVDSSDSWAHPLDDQHILVGIPCWLAAYNSASVLFVVDKSSVDQALPEIALAKLENPERQKRLLEAAEIRGAHFDSATGVLSSYYKARGVGDCGVYLEWIWSGEHFSLLKHNEMPECRGQIQWLNLWRAQAG